MNVYDFDNTIYDGDSTADFYLFSIKRHKKIALKLPSLFCAFFNFYVLKNGTKTEFKQKMYRFWNVAILKKTSATFGIQTKAKLKVLP